jgi:hypothetical protein
MTWMMHALRRQTITATMILLILVGAAGTVTGVQSGGFGRSVASVTGIKVQGNKIVDATGQSVVLHGVNRSGTEYACVQGFGPFDGPSDATSIAAIRSWNVNAVRIPINEDCWLGINGEPNGGYSAATYQQAIVNYVNLLHQNGIYAILELHWTAPGAAKATYQTNLPDFDHSPAMWASVANTFKNDPATLFDLFNEPNNDGQTCGATSPAACGSNANKAWWCWQQGGGCVTNDNSATFGSNWRIAGMNELISAVRGTGSTNIVMVGGLQYANDFTQWLNYKPVDSINQMAASFHLYNFNACNNVTCWNANIAPVAAQVPLVTGEIGEDDGAHGLIIDPYTSWADARSISYLAWTWNIWGCGNGPVLISSFDGTPCQTFGSGYKAHLASLTTLPTPTPTATPTPTPSATPTATPTPTPTPTATPTATPTPAPTSSGGSCTLTVAGVAKVGTCVQNVNGSTTFMPNAPVPTPTPTATATATPTPTPTPTATPAAATMLVGVSSTTANPDGNSPGQAQAYPYTAAASGTMSTLNVYVDSPNQATSIVLGVYSDQSGPLTLLGTCTITNARSGAWNSCSASASLVQGHAYWLAVLGPVGTGTVAYRDSAGSNPSKGSAQTNLTALPATWTSSSAIWGNGPASVYAAG